MSKFDVQLVLGELKIDGTLVFNEQDLKIDTFKTTYVIKYINIQEYYFKDDGIAIITETNEYILVTDETKKIKNILDDKLKIEKEVIIDGEENQEEISSTKINDHLLFSDDNKYGNYNFYNNHMVIDYREAGFDCDNLIINYSDIEDLDFTASSTPEYMFLHVVLNNGETYDFYFNKDKVNECEKVLKPRINIEKEVYEDGSIDSNQERNASSNATAFIIGTSIFVVGIILFFCVTLGNNDSKTSGIPEDIQGNYLTSWYEYGFWYADELVLNEQTADYIIWSSSSNVTKTKYKQTAKVVYSVVIKNYDGDNYGSFDLYNEDGEKKFECHSDFGYINCTSDTGSFYTFYRER